MRTIVDAVDEGSFLSQQCLHLVVDGLQLFKGAVATGNDGLVADNDAEIARVVDGPDGFSDARQQFKVVRMGQEALDAVTGCGLSLYRS